MNYIANNRLPEFDSCTYANERAVLLAGDCLEEMAKIPDRSCSLILTDPPYHSTKKKNIYGDTFFQEDAEYLQWMDCVSEEWARVLKLSGSVFCFCSSAMEAKLQAVFSKRFNILSSIVWTKPNEPGFDGWKQKMNKGSLRQWYPHTERIIFMELADPSNIFREPFGGYIKEKRLAAGLTMHELTEITGEYGKVNHGGAVANWEAGRNVPSAEQYAKICAGILSTKKVDSMLDYRDLVRPFLNGSTDPFTDVWEFQNVRPYKGKHPAEKPIDMLRHAIKATTYPGDIVLDSFAGSGSTAIAALGLGRKSISIEIEEKWCHQISGLLGNEEIYRLPEDLRINGVAKLKPVQESLFG